MTRKTMKKMMATTLTMVMIGSTALGSTAVFAADGVSEKVEGAEGLNIGATYYTLQTEFCMRMDNAAQKWAEENGVKYKSYDGNNDAGNTAVTGRNNDCRWSRCNYLESTGCRCMFCMC